MCCFEEASSLKGGENDLDDFLLVAAADDETLQTAFSREHFLSVAILDDEHFRSADDGRFQRCIWTHFTIHVIDERFGVFRGAQKHPAFRRKYVH